MPSEKDLSTNTAELYELYQTLGKAAPAEAGAEALSQKEERVYAASQWQLMWRKFAHNRVALLGGLVVVLFYLAALLGDFLAPYTLTTRFKGGILMPPQRVHLFDGWAFRPYVYGYDLNIDENLRKHYTPNPEQKVHLVFLGQGEPYKFLGLLPADRHLFVGENGEPVALLGSDRQGRDLFTRILLGSQVSLTIGLLGVLLSLVLGTLLGLTSGYFGGWLDELIQRVIELVRSIPSIPLWMAMSAAIPSQWNELQTYFAITLILSLIGWTWLARQLRGTVLTLRGEDYVTASALAGAGDGWIIFKHLVPATFGHIIVVSTLALPTMILSETALSYLGLGLRPPITSWGVLLQESQNMSAIALYPWLFIPAAVLAVCIMAFSYLGDGLRDAVDPYTL